MATQSTIPVTFDKSHLTTIGRQLYSQSLDLVRELVANSYDADATTVKISVEKDKLSVDDNGNGMNRRGLIQYFTIGSQYKRSNPISQRYKRIRIGEFGIGKFAVLALCDRFKLFTRADGYAATVVFDKNDFEKGNSWQIPLIEHRQIYATSGTTVTLYNLKRAVSTAELARKLRQQLPLNDKNFSVYLNGVRLTPTYIPGRRFRVITNTHFGPIRGEIIIASLQVARENIGIAVKVKGMTIKRFFFCLDKSKLLAPKRISGEIRADFLPITASRDNFLTDTPQWHEFEQVMKKRAKKIIKKMRQAHLKRKTAAANKALSEALARVRNALRKNSDIFLTHDLPLFSPETERQKILQEAIGAGVFTQRLAKRKGALAKSAKLKGTVSRKLKRKTRQRVKTVLKDQNRLVKKLKIGGVNIVCSLSSLGEDEVESFTEGGVIFINRDHPLFKDISKDEKMSSYHLARLITKEITLLAKAHSAEQAFNWQSRLLTDALVEKKRAVGNSS